MIVDYKTPDEVIAAIGNVIESHVIDTVLYTLSADAKVRINDADTGWNVTVIRYRDQASAEAGFAKLLAEVRAQGAAS